MTSGRFPMLRLPTILALLAALLAGSWPVAAAPEPGVVDVTGKQPGDVLARGTRSGETCAFEPVLFVLSLSEEVGSVDLDTALTPDCKLVVERLTLELCPAIPGGSEPVVNAYYQASFACSTAEDTASTYGESDSTTPSTALKDASNPCVPSLADPCTSATTPELESVSIQASGCEYSRTLKSRYYTESWWNKDVTAVEIKMTFRYHCLTRAAVVSSPGVCSWYSAWGWRNHDCVYNHGSPPSSTSVQRGATGTFSDGCCDNYHSLTTRVWGENSGLAQCTYTFWGDTWDGPYARCSK